MSFNFNFNAFTNFATAVGTAVGNNPALVNSIITAAQQNFSDPNEATEVADLKKAAALFAAKQGSAGLLEIAEVNKLLPTSAIAVQMGLNLITADTPPLEAIQAINVAIAAIEGK